MARYQPAEYTILMTRTDTPTRSDDSPTDRPGTTDRPETEADEKPR